MADAPGVVTAVELEPGMFASAATPVLRLAHDGPRDVVFSVPEDKVAVVKSLATVPGRFKVRLRGASADPLAATVREITAAADPVTRTFLIKADVGSAAKGAVRLGQTASVSMELPQVAGVTKLPLSALREEKGRSAVWLVERGSVTVTSQQL